MRKVLSLVLFAFMVVAGSAPAAADTIKFDFKDSTPVGSWQEREVTTKNDKGEEHVTVMRMSYLGDEKRGGEDFVWTETEISNYKVKRGERKPQGKPIIMKVLTKKSIYEGDIANALGNFSDLATEVIMQVGDGQPMRIKDAGSAMGPMAQAVGLKVNYNLTADGEETITVPAGSFNCARYRGEGQTSAKVMFKSIEVHSRATQWISQKVPFGVVKVISDDVVNGKPEHTESVLKAFGRSGATSKITGEPQDMPSMGKLFGGGK